MKCLDCGKQLDGHTDPFDNRGKPRVGDVSLCLDCGAIALFDDASFGLLLRKPTAVEMKLLQTDPKLMSVRIARSKLRRAGAA